MEDFKVVKSERNDLTVEDIDDEDIDNENMDDENDEDRDDEDGDDEDGDDEDGDDEDKYEEYSNEDVQENKLKKGACEKESDTVFVDIARANFSQKQCVICNKKRGIVKYMKRVSHKAIIESYVQTGIMIQFGCRTCAHHISKTGFFTQHALSITIIILILIIFI